MIQHLRSRLRLIVATTICALVAAPALITGTSLPDAAAPPGITNATLTVNGAGTGSPWQFDSGVYNELKAALTNTNIFGPNGVFKKGTFAVPATAIAGPLTFGGGGTLDGLDVFFAGMPNGGIYSGAEMTALQAFNADGRALVLNANTPNFGDVTSFLGFTMRSSGRAFFGNEPECAWSFPSEHAPTASTTTAPSHKVADGPFGTASAVTNYHTVQVFTSLPPQAQG